MSLWALRVLFLSLCALGGYMISQVNPDLIDSAGWGIGGGLIFAGLLIALDEFIKGFSLRAFSAASFGLGLGTVIALLIDNSGLFNYVDVKVRWLIRLCLFLGFGYIGMILAMRSNKEDFYLIIPFVRFASQSKPENLLVLDTSVIIDGRVADLIEGNFIEGVIVIPRFVLKELHVIADSSDPIRRARGRRGLEALSRIQRNARNEVKVHEADIPEETEVDAKLVKPARALGAKLYTNDYNLGKIAELQSVSHVNINELAKSMRPTTLPGDSFNLRIVREGKDKGQGVGYLNDGTMVVVNQAQTLVGQQVEVQVQSLVRTGAGVIIFADVKTAVPA